MRLNRLVSTPQEPPLDDEDDSAALSWSGDDARGQVTAKSRAAAAAASADAAVAAGDAAAPVPAETVAPRSPAKAVTVGIFGGLYLAYTIGWILSVLRIPSNSSDLFSEAMWQFGEFFAAIAAALWFGATIYLTRESRFLVRLGWLLLGLLVLIPWPVFLLAAPL